MQDYCLDTKTRLVHVYTCKDLVLGDFVVVSVISKLTGKTLAKYEVPKHEPFKSYAALIRFAKANRLGDAPQSLPSLQAVEPNADTCPPCHHPIHDDKGVIFLDTETTGLSDTDTIVDIALVDIDENVIFQSLVNPNKPIPKSATAVHGITDDMVADAPSFTDIYQHIDELCKGKTVVMYNANFDLRMIGQSYQRFLPQTYHCLMIEYAKHWSDWDYHHQSYKWQKLINACTQQQIQILDVIPHRAVGDAILTARLYRQHPHWKPRRRHRQWLFNVH